MLLEVCAGNYQSAINANEAEAHRIELCENLAVGGLTPNPDLLNLVLDQVSIPVFVLIRPRAGDFVYTDEEFKEMKKTILKYKNTSCSGIVSGVLNKDNTVDLTRTRELVELSKPLPFTFHRAFDEVQSPTDALEQLIGLGINRILTSGQQTIAAKGIDLIKKLMIEANDRITVLPGAGINPENAKLFKQAGLNEIHASATGNGNISKIEVIKEILQSVNE